MLKNGFRISDFLGLEVDSFGYYRRMCTYLKAGRIKDLCQSLAAVKLTHGMAESLQRLRRDSMLSYASMPVMCWIKPSKIKRRPALLQTLFVGVQNERWRAEVVG